MTNRILKFIWYYMYFELRLQGYVWRLVVEGGGVTILDSILIFPKLPSEPMIIIANIIKCQSEAGNRNRFKWKLSNYARFSIHSSICLSISNLFSGMYSGFWKGGCGREAPEKFFSHPPPFRIPPLLDLIGSVVGMKRCKKTIFFHPHGCKAPKRPTLNTPIKRN